jgi:glycosyl transferase, family 25
VGAPLHALAEGSPAEPLASEIARRRIVIPVYVINLARSPERRAWMEAELARAGVEGRFVRAVDGRRFEARCGKLAAETLLSHNEVGVSLSHRKVWRRLLRSEANHAIVLEDDVRLSGGMRDLVGLDWSFWDFDLVKFETMLDFVWVSRLGDPAGERKLHQLGAEHHGTAAYLISRNGARKMLAASREFREGIDFTMFGRRAIESGLVKALQLTPAVAIQQHLRPEENSANNLPSTLADLRERRGSRYRRSRVGTREKICHEAHRLVDQFRRFIRLAPTMRRRRIPWG